MVPKKSINLLECEEVVTRRGLNYEALSPALTTWAFFMAKYDNRKTSAQRGYGYRWQQARKQFLQENPFCADHRQRGKKVLATVVDHKIPHRGDERLFWDRTNWQSLCKQCHDTHKQRLEKSGSVIGCNENGIPIDSNHHWNK